MREGLKREIHLWNFVSIPKADMWMQILLFFKSIDYTRISTYVIPQDTWWYVGNGPVIRKKLRVEVAVIKKIKYLLIIPSKKMNVGCLTFSYTMA